MSVSAAPEQMCQPKSMNFVRKMYVGTRIPSVEPHGLARGFSQHCMMQNYDIDIDPTDKACVHWWNKEEHERIERLNDEAQENRRKELWKIYAKKDPIKLPIVNDGYGMIPECPICGEMPYSTEQCYWCGQRFVQDEEVEEYATPQTINGNCFNCGADVVIHVSKYNGHKSYHCNKCGCSIMG